MKKITKLTIAVLFSTNLVSQPVIQWQKNYGGSLNDIPRSIFQSNNGDYWIMGHTLSSDGDIHNNNAGIDFWVLILDSVGNIQSSKVFGGSGNDWLFNSTPTDDGGCILVGSSDSNDGDVSGNHGGKDGWVVKLDSSINIEWQKCLGGSGWDEIWDVQQTEEGGYILCGFSNSIDGDVTNNNGSYDYWIIKLNYWGLIEWQKTYGGSLSDKCYGIDLTSKDGYIVVGSAASDDGDLVGIHPGMDIWVINLDDEGKINWQRELGGSWEERGNDIIQTHSGDFALCGYSYSDDGDLNNNNGQMDCWIVKLDTFGQVLWQKSLGGSSLDNCLSIAENNIGDLFVTGSTNSNDGDVSGNNGSADIWSAKINANGETLWKAAFGGTLQDGSYCIIVSQDEGLLIAGDAWSNDGDVEGEIKGLNDFWILKLAPETSDAIEPVHPLLQIYPNPANTYIRVQGIDTQQDGQVIISDALGRMVMTLPLQTAASLELEPLPPGMYFLLARYADGKQMNGKFQKVE